MFTCFFCKAQLLADSNKCHHGTISISHYYFRNTLESVNFFYNDLFVTFDISNDRFFVDRISPDFVEIFSLQGIPDITPENFGQRIMPLLTFI